MDAKLKADWVKALRSGEYSQAVEKLHDVKTDGYCCLGVLCKVMGASVDDFSPSLYEHVPVLKGEMLSNGGVEELHPTTTRRLGLSLVQDKLITLNDGYAMEDTTHPAHTRRHTFPEIADWIEANIPADEPEVSL